MALRISVGIDAKRLRQNLDSIARQQLPFAISQALNATAQRVIEAGTSAIDEAFDQPRDFTRKAFTQSASFGGQRASKREPVAVVVAKPAQEQYLAPSEFGEQQSLGRGRRIRTPVGIKTNAGGNIPRDAIRQMLNDPDVFLGTVRGVNGLWQRPATPRAKGAPKRKVKANTTGRLKLLVAFTKPVVVRSRLHFYPIAQRVVETSFDQLFDIALARAWETAKR